MRRHARLLDYTMHEGNNARAWVRFEVEAGSVADGATLADAESVAQVRLDAHQTLRSQQRAVTEADWARVAQRHPAVEQAAARLRWTGSWTTVFVTIDH